jgi:hypothetical protein
MISFAQIADFLLGGPPMQARAFYVSVAFLMFVTALLSQEGHPLVGTWHGNWGPDQSNRTDLTVVMDWDGKVISGLVNPGFDQAPLQNAKLNPKDWTVHFEIDSKDSSGKTVRCLVDGKIDKLGSDRRTLTGTWNCGAAKADFKLTRDRDY